MGEREYRSDLEPEDEQFMRDFGPMLTGMKARHARCPSLELILAAESRTLPEEAAAQLAEHIAGCDWCRALRNDWREFEFPAVTPESERRIRARALPAVTRVVAQPRRPAWRWLVPLGAAATLVLTFVLVRDASRPDPRSGPASSTKPSGDHSEQSAGMGAPRPVSVFRLEKPPVRLPLSAAVVWRGEGEADRARFSEEFKAAMAFYRADNYATTAARLKALARQFPRSPDVSFYLGVCQLFLGRDREAIASLERARGIAKDDRADEISWYLALAHQRAGRVAPTVDLLGSLCQGSGPYSAQACAGIRELRTQDEATGRR